MAMQNEGRCQPYQRIPSELVWFYSLCSSVQRILLLGERDLGSKEIQKTDLALVSELEQGHVRTIKELGIISSELDVEARFTITLFDSS